MTVSVDFYGNKDPRDLPRYTYPEAARATGVPATTIKTWVYGDVIERPDEGRLSFNNLIDIHVLRALRTKQDVRFSHIREAIEVAESRYGIGHLFRSEQLCSSAGQLFLDNYTELLALSKVEQIAMRGILLSSLSRIDYDNGIPKDFFPLERTTNRERKLILVSPLISFGRAVVQRVGVSTQAIADRLNAKEPPESILEDYGLDVEELNEAAAYEAAA